MEKILLQPTRVGVLDLPNRIVMAPMTRSRATADGVPTADVAVYYAQRATAGLIVTEGTAPSAMGLGYARTPGIYSKAQIESWRNVTEAVHGAGGKIFLQLMHVGRIAHEANRTIPDPPIAPSAIRAAGMMWTDSLGMQPNAEPRALETAEIPGVVAEFGQATRNALEAGFDGVELHAASGYLPMQFLSTNTNLRTDAYGGSARNRVRFVVEALQAMADAAGTAAKVGMKISPCMPFNDIHDADPAQTYGTLIDAIDPLGLAYLHIMRVPGEYNAARELRPRFKGALLLGGGFNPASAEETLAAGDADLIVFGSSYVANPDMVARIAKDADLSAPDPSTFYTPGPRGYIDYPPLP